MIYEYALSDIGQIVADPGMTDRVGFPDEISRLRSSEWERVSPEAIEFAPAAEVFARDGDGGGFIVLVSLDGDTWFYIWAATLGGMLDVVARAEPAIRAMGVARAEGEMENALSFDFGVFAAPALFRARALLIAAGMTRDEVDELAENRQIEMERRWDERRKTAEVSDAG